VRGGRSAFRPPILRRPPGWDSLWPNRRPWSPPVSAYGVRVRTPIPGYVGQAFVSGSGGATVQLGPTGYGVRWYPYQAKIATSSGAADTSTCTLYLGVISSGTQIGGQSYAGGGDVIGLAGDMLQPGEFIIAVWAGAKPGDLATLRLSGDQDAIA
jgi:hypothetical protein